MCLFHSHICEERASEPWRTRGSQVLSFAPCPSLKVTCFPVVHCLKKEVEWWGLWGSELLCKAIILFTSRCMYKEWQREDGNVREMSNACRPCPVYFTGWNVHSREEGTDQGGGGGARSHLLMTKQNRRLSYMQQITVNGCDSSGANKTREERWSCRWDSGWVKNLRPCVPVCTCGCVYWERIRRAGF